MEIPKDCPPILSNIINLCWKQDPIERPNFYDIIQLLKEKKTNNTLENYKNHPENFISINDYIIPNNEYNNTQYN